MAERRQIQLVVSDEELDGKELDWMDMSNLLVQLGLEPAEQARLITVRNFTRHPELGASVFLLEHESYDALGELEEAPKKRLKDKGIVPASE